MAISKEEANKGSLEISESRSSISESAKSKSRGFNGWLGFKKNSSSPSTSLPTFNIKSKGSPSDTVIAQVTSSTSFNEIDIDSMVYLFQFLSVETLLNLKNVSKRFQYFVSLDRVWAYRLKCISYSTIEWNLGLSNSDAATPQMLIQAIWEDLRDHYLQFRNLNNDANLATFHCGLQLSSSEALVHISKTLLKLTHLSKAKMVEDWIDIHNNISIMKNYYESALLTNLGIAYGEQDIEELKVQCTALQELADGNIGIRWLIEQNPIFVYQSYTLPEDLFDADSICSIVKQYFEAFHSEIISENDLLAKILPDPTEGNTVFIEQLFRDCLAGLLHPILNSAEEQSDMVPALYSQILVACLEHGNQLLLQIEQEKVAVDLNRAECALFFFFQPLLDIYAKNELLFLELNYSTMTKGFLYSQFGTLDTSAQETQQNFLKNIDQQRRKVMNSMSKAFNSNMFNFSRQNQIAHNELDFDESSLEDIPKRKIKTNDKAVSEAPCTSIYSFSSYVSIDMASDMAVLNKQSLQRIGKFKRFSKFSACEQLVKNTVEQIFSCLTSYLGVHHVSKGFEVAFRLLRAHQSSQFQSLDGELVGPVTSFFQMIKAVDGIQGTLEKHYHQELRHFIDPNDFLDTCNIAKKRFETSIDEMVASGLDLSIQTLMHHVHSLLQHYQTTSDFKPGHPLDHLRPTKACQEVVNCLIAHVSNVRRGDLESHILEVFYKEIALRLFHDLCKHIKAFTFDEAGGYQLLSDLSGYFSWVATLDIPDIINHFQALKEVANLFLLSPENLKILLHDQERFLGIFHPEDLLEFVQRRVDYRKIQKHIEVEGCSVM